MAIRQRQYDQIPWIAPAKRIKTLEKLVKTQMAVERLQETLQEFPVHKTDVEADAFDRFQVIVRMLGTLPEDKSRSDFLGKLSDIVQDFYGVRP